MAAFSTVQDKTTSVPTIVNSISDTTQPAANKSIGSAIEGSSSIFEDSVNAGKASILKTTETKLQAGYDEENDQNGVSRAALQAKVGVPVSGARPDSEDPVNADPIQMADGSSAPGTTPSTTPGASPGPLNSGGDAIPAPAQAMLDRAQRMERANGAGKLTPSDYNAKMEALVRSVRAEYPQFRDEIDAQMHTITGMTPANALRASQLRDQNAALRQAQSADQKAITFVQTNSKYLDPADMNRSIPEQTLKIRTNMSIEGGQDRKLAVLNVNAKTDASVAVQATQLGTQYSDDIATRRLSGVMNPDNLSETEMKQKWNNLTPTEIAGNVKQIGLMRAESNAELEKKLSTMTDNGRTIGQNMSPSDLTTLRAQHNQRYQAYIDSYTSGDFGAITRFAMDNKLKTDSVEGQMLSDRSYMAAKLMNNALGPEGMNLYLRTKDKDGNTPMIPLVQMVSKVNRLEAASGSTDGRSHLPSGPMSAARDTRAVLKQEGIKDPEITAQQFRGVINDFVSSTTNEKADPTARYNLAKSIIRDASFFHTTFSAGSGQTEAYSLMTSPAMSDAMWKMNETHPEVWQAWRKYTSDNFIGVNQMGKDTLDSLTRDRDIKVTQDPKTGMFSVDHSDSSPFKNDKKSGDPTTANKVLQSYQTRVDGFNKSLTNLGYMLGKDKKEVGPELLQMAHDLGINVNNPKDDFWGKVVTAVMGNIKPGVLTQAQLKDMQLENDPVIGRRPEK